MGLAFPAEWFCPRVEVSKDSHNVLVAWFPDARHHRGQRRSCSAFPWGRSIHNSPAHTEGQIAPHPSWVMGPRHGVP